MWVFTPFGFFSAVRHRDRPDHVLVRARARADLVALLGRCVHRGKRPTIKRTPNADYPYRVELTKGVFANFLHAAALELDYPNFKSEVARRQGFDRESVYHAVWSELRGIEDAGSRRSTTWPGAFSISSR